jgi:glycosyltransferase involved in cell wall biosynthesis
MAKLSVIIPSYNCKYVNQTIQNIFENAVGDIEVICILDGYWPAPEIQDHKNLTIVHNGLNKGMRNSINQGAALSKGKYILKTDDHCAFSKGFDEAIQKDIDNDWLVIPGKYSLDPLTWKPVREVEHYFYMAYPYDKESGIGLYAKKWWGANGINPPNMGVQEFYRKEHENAHILIDDLMIFPGACWMTSKDHFNRIDGLDENLFKTLYGEPAELSFKTFLSGGRVIVNKNCWYAHMYKGDDAGDKPNVRGYVLDVDAMRATEKVVTHYWMNDSWPKATKKMEWLIEKFWPIPGWSDNWKQEKLAFESLHPIR